jgi:hypothetical protein
LNPNGHPSQNRVTPLSELIATPERGLVYGNRGCLHNDRGAIVRHHQVRRWIACRLEFKDRHRSPLRQPGRYTELFFLDEATALAAGHRPCAECRRADYNRLKQILSPGAPITADEIDAQLHQERLQQRSTQRRLHELPAHELPDGAFVLHDNAPHLVLQDQLLRWTPAGYAERTDRHTALPATATTRTITPPSLLALLHVGWEPLVPLLHPSASRSAHTPPAAS